MRPLPLVILLVASAAHADVTGSLGAGIARVLPGNDGGSFVPAVDVYLGQMLDEHWSVGGHLQATWPASYTQNLQAGGGGDFENNDDTVNGGELALAARYDQHQWWISPWLGAHLASVKIRDYGQAVGDRFDTTSTSSSAALDAGVSVGVVVLQADGDRYSVYADFHLALAARTESPLSDWSVLTFGLAYSR